MESLMSKMDEHWIIDVGNTRTKLVVFQDDSIVQVLSDEEAEAHGQKAMNEGRLPAFTLVAASGEFSKFWNAWSREYADRNTDSKTVFNLVNAKDTGLPSNYESMATLGLDRAANARAAQAEDPDSNWLIIDAGTCITADWIEHGNFIGGSIAPGIELRLRAMYAGTANLPYPENWRELTSAGIGLHIGQNTIDALLAGAIGGANAELQARIEAFDTEYDEFRVGLTGGDADCLELRTRFPIFADPNLTWKGYHLILKDLVQND
jgi:type III pantothenate kinase